jgi:hypothetical protein
MYQTTQNDQSKLPTVFAKIKGNHVAQLKKDDLIWHSQYESILRITVVFLQVEKANSQEERELFEKAVKIYLKDKGFDVMSTKYYDDATTLKQYLTMQKQ